MPYMKVVIVAVLAALVAAVVIGKAQRQSSVAPAAASDAMPPAATVAPAPLPRLVDLGANACVPCKLMAPILEEMRSEYAGRLKVDFIDVWQDPDQGEKYGIRVIPTQIFYDASGKELFRHEGFMSKEDILARWAALGVPLGATAIQTPPAAAAGRRREKIDGRSIHRTHARRGGRVDDGARRGRGLGRA